MRRSAQCRLEARAVRRWGRLAGAAMQMCLKGMCEVAAGSSAGELPVLCDEAADAVIEFHTPIKELRL